MNATQGFERPARADGWPTTTRLSGLAFTILTERSTLKGVLISSANDSCFAIVAA